MIIIGLTGGIASGKSTIVKFLKRKKIAVHDSDSVINNSYSKPNVKFINYLKRINLKKSLKRKKINKKIIRDEIFFDSKKRKLLEKYLHKEVKKDRNIFLKKHKQKKTKIVFLDIPLLFENKLEKICNYSILLYSPLKIRKQRAMKRMGMSKKILEKIIENQLTDKIKKIKSDYVINTSKRTNQSFNDLLKIIDLIKTQQQCEKLF